MELLPDLQTLTLWLTEYGSIFLFVLLAMGIIAFPVPEETLMLIAGILMRQGTLAFPGTALAAWGGSITGITVSYLLGRTLGIYCLARWGSWVGLTEKRIEKAHQWFETYGKWALFIGYFIPGVRHFTGLSAGAAGLELKEFMLFAYLGALFWVTLFLSFGFFFGHFGLAAYERFEFAVDSFFIFVTLGVVLFVGAIAFIVIQRKR